MLTPLRFARLIVVAVLLAGTSSVLAKATPEKCQASKNLAAGKYASCRQSAEAKLATSGDQVKFAATLAKCEEKLRSTWDKLEAKATKAMTSCLDDALSVDDFESLIQSCADTVAAGLGTGTLPSGGNTLLGTNQTTCYDVASNMPTACAGTGQDGELRKGLGRSYTDNGTTITDNQTGLTWEKLVDDDSVHDQDNIYTWAQAFAKVQELNTAPCFAGHCDWRVPNVNELHSLIDYGSTGLPVGAVFNMNCAPACTAMTPCSCTPLGAYWSSTTYTTNGDATGENAWEVLFDLGYVVIDVKNSAVFVRAVRGGA